MFARPGSAPIRAPFAEMVRLFMENGKSEADARDQAKVCRGLGSTVWIGDRWYALELEDDE